jgi:hypothetical protein
MEAFADQHSLDNSFKQSLKRSLLKQPLEQPVPIHMEAFVDQH